LRPIDRRKFAAGMLAAGVATSTAQATSAEDPEHFMLGRNGWMPNNARLPVLLYRGGGLRTASKGGEDLAAQMERMFTANGWPPQWRDGIYTFHHFHSTAHEILGIAAGEVRVVLGGEGGRELTLGTGDVVALPTGTGHCCLHSSPDLLVVGAYPAGQHWDICRSAPSAEMVEAMGRVPFPSSDPVHGHAGALTRLWKAS